MSVHLELPTTTPMSTWRRKGVQIRIKDDKEEDLIRRPKGLLPRNKHRKEDW